MTPAAAPLFSAAFLGWILLLLAVAWSGWAGRRESAAPAIGWPWWLLTAAALLCFRWPMFWIQHQLNPDESQLIAGALTLRHDPVFWRAVDGATAGPLDYYPLLPAAWADGFASYAVARLIALAVVFATMVFAGETLALLAGAALARIAVLPALAAVAFTTSPDFTHYSTELMPALLLAAAGYAAVRQDRAPAPRWLWLTAVLLGSVLWAKLQAAPLAGAMWVLVAVNENRSGRPRSLWPLVAGALLPAVVCFGAALLTGQIEHLVTPYLLHNLAYVGAPHFSWLEVAAGQAQNALSDGYLGFWLAGAALCLVPLAGWHTRSAPAASRRGALAAVLLLALGVFSALAPRRPSAHHLQLLPLPWLWLTGTGLALAWPREATSASTGKHRWLAVLFLVCALGPQLAWRIGGIDSYAAINAAGIRPARRELARLVRVYSTPGETLAVWGWRCSLYVEAGRPQATRQAQTETQLSAGPLQPYFLRRYLEDFRSANPPVFADAVGPGNFAYTDRARAHECFPPLRQWVQARYTQVADLDGTRLYVRNDRLATVSRPSPTAR